MVCATKVVCLVVGHGYDEGPTHGLHVAENGTTSGSPPEEKREAHSGAACPVPV